MLMLGIMPSETKCAACCSVGGMGVPEGIACDVAAEVGGASSACACVLTQMSKPISWVPLWSIEVSECMLF